VATTIVARFDGLSDTVGQSVPITPGTVLPEGHYLYYLND